MYANAAVQVQVVFSDVAKHALDPDSDATDAMFPASFLARAHFAVPGDLVQLQGCPGLFVVSQRVWDLRSGAATLQLVLDVLVKDND
jgi:hypothetical protein